MAIQRRNNFARMFETIIYDSDVTNTPSLDVWSSFFVYADPFGFDDALYQTYRLSAGNTLEGIAFEIYGDTRLWWLIPLANNVEDPFDFLETVLQGDEYENAEIRVFDPQYLRQIQGEIESQVRRRNVQFRQGNKK